MNGMRMNQSVAPTSFITSISRRRANIAVRIVFQISSTAANSRKPDSSEQCGTRRNSAAGRSGSIWSSANFDLVHAREFLERGRQLTEQLDVGARRSARP